MIVMPGSSELREGDSITTRLLEIVELHIFLD